MYNRLDSIPACDIRTNIQTDRQTEGQTDILRRHSPRYAYASHGKNTAHFVFCLHYGSPLANMVAFSLLAARRQLPFDQMCNYTVSRKKVTTLARCSFDKNWLIFAVRCYASAAYSLLSRVVRLFVRSFVTFLHSVTTSTPILRVFSPSDSPNRSRFCIPNIMAILWLGPL